MSGVYSNTVNIMQFSVTGDVPTKDRFEWLSGRLSSRAFVSIEKTPDEASEGWTRTDAIDNPTFDVPAAVMRDNYALFSLRLDRRKISSGVLKSKIAKEEKKFLKDHPDLRRVPKGAKSDIKERVRGALLAKAEPEPSIVDVVWDLKAGVLSLFNTSKSTIDRFETIFRKTFDGLHLTVIHPYARAERLTAGDDGLRERLAKSNQAGSDAVASLIADNKWIGSDFLLWVLYRGINGDGEYRVSVGSDDVAAGGVFSAWLDDKIALEGGGSEGGKQKVAVSGSQDAYKEVHAALCQGKRITSATMYLQDAEENAWKLTLDGELFAFKGYKAPPVQIEKDDSVDEMSEREAAFYERMFLLGRGEVFFDSLFRGFLKERLGDWERQMSGIKAWLAGEE